MTLEFRGPRRVPVKLQVNGEQVELYVEPARILLSILREDLGLTGAKQGCSEGNCGACTVLLNGEAVYACLTLAIDMDSALAEDAPQVLHKTAGNLVEPDGDVYARGDVGQGFQEAEVTVDLSFTTPMAATRRWRRTAASPAERGTR